MQIYVKNFIFIMFYAVQIYWTIYQTFIQHDPTRSIRNIYLLFIMSDFFLVIFFKFNYAFIIIISAMNFSITVLVESVSDFNLAQQNYVLEIVFSI